MGISTSWNPQGLPRPVQVFFTFTFILVILSVRARWWIDSIRNMQPRKNTDIDIFVNYSWFDTRWQ